MFPDHEVDIEDDDSKKVRQWRRDEFDRRFMRSAPTSRPATTQLSIAPAVDTLAFDELDHR
jgi:hypothetical protein